MKPFFDKLRKGILEKDLFSQIEVLKEKGCASTYDKSSAQAIIRRANILVDQKHVGDDATRVGDDVYRDLELFQSYESDHDNDTVFHHLNYTRTHGGRMMLCDVLQRPVHDIAVLEKRQQVMRALTEAVAAQPAVVEALLTTLQSLEKDVLWLYEEREDAVRTLYDMVYFKSFLTRRLNKYDSALTINNLYRIVVSPLAGILSPVVYFVVPYLILIYRLKIKVSFVNYLKFAFKAMFSTDVILGRTMQNIRYLSYGFTLVFYFQSVFNSVELSQAMYTVTREITHHVRGLRKFVDATKQLDAFVSTATGGADLQTLFFQGGASSDDETPADDDVPPSSDRYFMLTNFGAQLKTYKSFKHAAYIPTLRRAYMMDALLSIVKLGTDKGFGYATFREGNGALMRMTQVWHPSLSLDSVVKNDMVVKNCIITGPNAGGKSTVLKSVMLGVLLAQTLTLGNFDACLMTPYAYINTQFNVPDCKGTASLFEAEMYRCKSTLDVLNQMQDKACIVAMDEIFSSTNPVEGIAGAFAIAKKIATYKHTVCMISTHFLYLTKLSKEAEYRLYRMNVEMDQDDSTISYPYKLSRGVSTQYIALEILRKNEFDEAILSEALSVKKRLLNKI